MIDVQQEAKLETVKTARELYEEIIGYYGRAIRVQTLDIEHNRDDFHYGFDERDYEHYARSVRRVVRPQDRFGRLLGARLNETSGWIEEDVEPTSFSGNLSIMLEGHDSIVLHELDRGRILLFQEDSRQWVPIFRGAKWKEVQR